MGVTRAIAIGDGVVRERIRGAGTTTPPTGGRGGPPGHAPELRLAGKASAGRGGRGRDVRDRRASGSRPRAWAWRGRCASSDSYQRRQGPGRAGDPGLEEPGVGGGGREGKRPRAMVRPRSGRGHRLDPRASRASTAARTESATSRTTGRLAEDGRGQRHSAGLRATSEASARSDRGRRLRRALSATGRLGRGDDRGAGRGGDLGRDRLGDDRRRLGPRRSSGPSMAMKESAGRPTRGGVRLPGPAGRGPGPRRRDFRAGRPSGSFVLLRRLDPGRDLDPLDGRGRLAVRITPSRRILRTISGEVTSRRRSRPT